MQMMRLQREASAFVLVAHSNAPVLEQVRADSGVVLFPHMPEADAEAPAQMILVLERPFVVLVWN